MVLKNKNLKYHIPSAKHCSNLLYAIINLMFITTIQSRYSDFPYFTDEETTAKKG
jgi:hypothetical protein